MTDKEKIKDAEAKLSVAQIAALYEGIKQPVTPEDIVHNASIDADILQLEYAVASLKSEDSEKDFLLLVDKILRKRILTWVWPENDECSCSPCYTPSASKGLVHPVIKSHHYFLLLSELEKRLKKYD